jgi:hypothetical protein
MFWLLTLPFRLVFGLLMLPLALLALPMALLLLPFLLLRVFVKATLFLFLLPIALLVGLIVAAAMVVASVAMVIPLLPVALLALCVWVMFRPSTQSPVRVV